jgi:hypothetical protein
VIPLTLDCMLALAFALAQRNKHIDAAGDAV